MATIILVILFVIFANIFANNPECEKKSYCECWKYNTNVSNIVYVNNKNVTFRINVKSWSNIQIECGDISWNDFNFTQIKTRGILDLIVFKNCTLPEETRLQYIVRKLGIKETSGLGFQSYRNLSNSLKKNHFLGFRFLNKLDLSHNGLTNISSDLFSNLPNLESLDLSENSLVLRKDFFNETLNLKQLDLNGNGITELANDLFYNLKHLETLNLQRNLLKNLDEIIFYKLGLLKNLNLSSNLLWDLPQKIFHNSKELETIDLSNNYFISLPLQLFNQNKKLLKVVLNDNKGRLTTLTDELLMNLENLEEVSFRRNEFNNIPEKLFGGSTSLKYIDFSENFIKELPEYIFIELENTERLFLSHNLIQTLPDTIFKYLQYLEVLDLSFNRISYVPSTLFNSLTSLKELNMEGNHMRYIEKMAFFTNKQLSIAKFSNNLLEFNYLNKTTSPFFNNHLLKELHLSNNLMKHLFSDWTTNKLELELLDLSYNYISKITVNDFVFTSDKVLVDLSYNNISRILLSNIEKLVIYNREKRNVIVHVENNPLICDCSLYDIVRYSNGDMASTVYNFFELRLGNLTCVKPNGTQGPQINQLDFKTYQCLEDDYFQSEKMCQTRCTCYIRPYDTTRILDCSYNKFSLFRIDKNKIKLKESFPLMLDLTGNFLMQIPLVDDLETIILTGLLLSNNKISELSVYRLPTTLKVLELHNNNLVKLSYDVIHYLYYQDLKELTLSGNPFKCDCDSRFLYLLVLKLQDTYKDLKNVKCKDHNITLVDMTIKQLCPSNVTPEKIIKTVE